MKKKNIILFSFVFFLPMYVWGSGNITEVNTDSNEKSKNSYVIEPDEEVLVQIFLPVEKIATLVHRIPRKFSFVEIQEITLGCKVIKKRSIPFLIFCKNISEDINILYNAHRKMPKQLKKPSQKFSGFSAGRYEKKTGAKMNFFEKIDFLFRVTSPASPENNTNRTEDKKIKSIELPPKPKLNTTSTKEKSTDIPQHELLLKDPESQISTSESNDVVISSYRFEPSNEPVIINELTVEIQDEDTTALYGDVLNDFEMIDSVSLWHQDGTPLLDINGKIAKSKAINSQGKALINNLNITISEKGEWIFIAVSMREMLENKSGSAFRARFSNVSADHKIRGFWSGSEYGKSAISFSSVKAPIHYILSNALILSKTSPQPSFLHSGENEILKFEADVLGKGNAFLHEVQVHLSKTSDAGSGFRVSRLRLKHKGATLASLSGFDLVGNQAFIMGQCAGGDSCESNDGNRHEISKLNSFLIESEITPLGAGFSSNNSLSARIEVNGNTPGNDGILWEDYGSGEDDGVQIRWVQTEENSITRIKNVVSGQ